MYYLSEDILELSFINFINLSEGVGELSFEKCINPSQSEGILDSSSVFAAVEASGEFLTLELSC